VAALKTKTENLEISLQIFTNLDGFLRHQISGKPAVFPWLEENKWIKREKRKVYVSGYVAKHPHSLAVEMARIQVRFCSI